MPKFYDRFARQNRFELPPEFPLASPYSGIVHHLSGPNIYALTQTFSPEESKPVSYVFLIKKYNSSHINSAKDFQTYLSLAYMLDSLVRVSRRDEETYFINIKFSKMIRPISFHRNN